MRQFLAFLVSVLLIFSLVSCGSTQSATNPSNDPSEESNNSPETSEPFTEPKNDNPADSAEDSLKTYPLYVAQEYVDKMTSLPNIIFSTTAEENSLANNIYSFSGTVTDASAPEGVDVDYIIVSTNNGPVFIGNMYKYIYEQLAEMFSTSELSLLDLDEVSDYVFPAVGETATFICTYQGYSGALKMPTFYLGANEAFFLDDEDPGESGNPTEPLPTESKPTEPKPTEPKPTEPKPTETKPTEPKPTETKPTEPKPTETKPTEPKPTDQPGSPTVSQQSALKAANRYLSFAAFSYTGLIEQLEFEGFSTADATYAADNCGADWMEQALKKAKSYLESMPFSHDGLIKQLEFEDFTSQEAAYGADNCGADWMEQALKKAKSYLESMAFSRDGLVEQLEFEDFTSAQAAYGADNCGADWMEQAVKKAKSYLDIMPFSRSELIRQLEFEGFTSEQAAYGADQNGL